MGMAVSEPPTVLGALERRVQAGEIEELRVYYSHAVAAAGRRDLKSAALATCGCSGATVSTAAMRWRTRCTSP
jgi:itaconate CoA-transferase